jgi:hypothetical protein
MSDKNRLVVIISIMALAVFILVIVNYRTFEPTGKHPSKESVNPDFANRRISPEKHLPMEATNVQCYNNYWTYFELSVGGKKRKFLMHHSHPRDDTHGRESLVELKE